MIRRIPAAEHHVFENEWLTARWHFSFGDYFDPSNVSFGPLRVFNHDRVRPESGFPPHSHQEMEIITVVLEGTLEHEDDRGNKGVLKPGDVQVMSAGTGIVHSEKNPSSSETLVLCQIWLSPWRRAVTPSWAQKSFPAEARRNALQPVVSREKKVAGTLPIHQDAFIYLCEMDEGRSVEHIVRQARRLYLFAAKGAGKVNGTAIEYGDAARVSSEEKLTITGGPGEFGCLLIDMV